VAIAYFGGNPISLVYRALLALKAFLLNPPYMFSKFPFVRFIFTQTDANMYIHNQRAIGMLFIPVVWYIFKLWATTVKLGIKHSTIKNLIISLPVLGIVLLLMTGCTGLEVRYEADFAWLLVLPALFCLGSDNKNIRTKLIIMTASILLVGFGTILNMHGAILYDNPKIYYYLERAFDIFGGM
jgi:hypothetical protein